MSEMTDEQLAEYEEKMAGDDYSNKAPRKAKQFWPSAKRLLGLLAPYKVALTAVFLMNAVSVLLAVYAPRVMGRAMDVIFSGVMSKHMPPGTTKEQAVEGLRAAGQDRFADMASAMDLTPGSGIDFDRLGQLIAIRCFTHDPSIESSLKFLRKTPWARQKVEALFVQLRRRG